MTFESVAPWDARFLFAMGRLRVVDTVTLSTTKTEMSSCMHLLK